MKKTNWLDEHIDTTATDSEITALFVSMIIGIVMILIGAFVRGGL